MSRTWSSPRRAHWALFLALAPIQAGAQEAAAAGTAMQAFALAPDSARAHAPSPVSAPEPPAPSQPIVTLTLAEALRLSFTQGRDKLTQDEQMRLMAYSLHITRLKYGPIPTGTLSTQRTGTSRSNSSTTNSADLAITQGMPTGGTLSLSSQASTVRIPGLPLERIATETASITQPLLANAGMLVWREALTEAERAYLYAERANFIFDENLAIGVASTYWSLQAERNSVDQADEAVSRAAFLLEQSRALMLIGKSNANDVFRAETGLLTARQSQVDAEAGYAAALENFRISLALPDGVRVELDHALPDGTRCAIDPAKAIAAALANRLDLLTAADQVQDSDRATRLARRALLPELDANASVSNGNRGSATWRQALTGPPVYSAGLTLAIPFVQYDQRLAYQNALIALSQSKRGYDQKRQQVIVDVLNTLNALRQAASTLIIQERTRVETRLRAEKAELDFHDGQINNRDLVEAQAEVTASENAWFSALVAYRTQELTLRANTGTMEIAADGRWAPLPPSYATTIPPAPDASAETPPADALTPADAAKGAP